MHSTTTKNIKLKMFISIKLPLLVDVLVAVEGDVLVVSPFTTECAYFRAGF